ncbi:hypothetical protein M409DRAFT_65650 [Zasmidium cellare ATCC 36951]|uniref:AB hydrolase-1 domain-containing protein n=1 Tax=Zasmidium cellare ATCC 36951 TaxID=1080233 RepID=A0A6A6CM70_ZASCE|nr:uncharacterized protein M409DRAFT_65650 [Zasmidium cellare ATCC 36951]KAF2168141.1 hypothetical protein M409DRAFT_65650 [Zasmidium cellare ATCC 36951]
MSKPTLVFVHGGWHDPSCLDLVRTPLEIAGYKCHVPDLPSIGKQAAIKTADDDIQIVHDLVADSLSNGEDVIVFGHSNGGLKANGALEGLVGDDAKNHKGKVLGLGLIAAMIPPIVEKGAIDVLSRTRDWQLLLETEPTFLPDDPTKLFYNDLPAEDAAYWTARIQPMAVPRGPLVFYEAWRHVPMSYLACTEDQGMPFAQQEAMTKAARAEGGTVHVTQVKSGHSPFLSVPDKMVEWVQKVAEVELKA